MLVKAMTTLLLLLPGTATMSAARSAPPLMQSGHERVSACGIGDLTYGCRNPSGSLPTEPVVRPPVGGSGCVCMQYMRLPLEV